MAGHRLAHNINHRVSASFITFTPEAEDHILSFLGAPDTSLNLYLVWGLKIADKNGRVVLYDPDWSIAISSSAPTEDAVALCIRGHTVHMDFRSFRDVAGRTVYLSHGHSSDEAVTSGDILKVA